MEPWLSTTSLPLCLTLNLFPFIKRSEALPACPHLRAAVIPETSLGDGERIILILRMGILRPKGVKQLAEGSELAWDSALLTTSGGSSRLPAEQIFRL